MYANRMLGRAWILLCLTLILHVTDEALTGFLSVYNPTVMALRERIAWLPLPVFRFEVWLAGLLAASAILLGLARFVYRGAKWMRPVAYLFAVLMTANAVGHTAGTVAGRTVRSVPFRRPMPGFYSSPVLLAASVYLLARLRASVPRPAGSAISPGSGEAG
jgi:hypothetical protein